MKAFLIAVVGSLLIAGICIGDTLYFHPNIPIANDIRTFVSVYFK